MSRIKLEKNPSSHNLPSAYQEVEYIEGTGTQYLITNFIPNNNQYNVEFKFRVRELPSGSAYIRIFGNLQASGNNYPIYRGQFKTTRNVILLGKYPAQEISIPSLSANTDYLVYGDYLSQTTTINGREDTLIYVEPTNENLSPIHVFYAGTGGSAAAPAVIYHIKFFNLDNTLALNLIPCYRKSDNVIGMYDTVSDVFYTNAGSGTFLKGTDIKQYNIIETERFALEKMLPQGFKKLEYLESTGTQFIETNYIPNNTSGILIKFSSDTTNTSVLCGAMTDYSLGVNKNWYIGRGDKIYSSWNTTDSASARPLFSINNIYITKLNYLNNRKRITNDEEYTPITQTLNTITNSAYLFASKNNSSAVYPSEVKIYQCQFTEGDEIVRDYIPALRESDNKPGMYDIINDIFYTNAGANEFIYDDIPETYQRVEWIKGDESQFIDTGYIPKNTSGISVTFSSGRNAPGEVVCGAITGGYQSGKTWYIGHSTNIYSSWNANDASASRPAFAINTVYNTKLNYLNNRKRITNDREYSSIGSTVLGNITNSAYLLGAKDSTSLAYPFAGTIYKCRFTEGAETVRNFIPCYRKSDNVIGVYDTINNIFYINAGTGTFTKGADINPVQQYNIIETERYCLEKILPVGFTKLDYIEGTGTQYIDTGVNTSGQSIEFECEFAPMDTAAIALTGVYGAKSPIARLYLRKRGYNAASDVKNPVAIYYGSSTSVFGTSELETDNFYTYKAFVTDGEQKLYLNGNLEGSASASGYFDSNNRSFTLFAEHGSNSSATTINTISKLKLRWARMKLGGVLTYDMIPAKINSDGIAGLYDLVNDIFYTNAGTGDFIISQNPVKQYNIIRIL